MKKWSKLVLATMLSAGTLLVSGCIENLEPEGIADLRGAKAELLRAQTALQAAQAAKVEAEAALVLAQAKVQEAIAKQEEAKVAYFEAQALAEQYRAELLNIQNEEARADLEKKIADMEAAMEDAENKALIAAEKFKVEMLEVLKTLAQAQLAYDQALLDIELARNTLTDKQNNYLNGKELAFRNAQSDVLAKTRALEDAADALAEAIATVDEAEAKDTQVRGKMREIAKLQAELEGLIEAQDEAEELMNLDPDLTDWDAEREALEEEIESLEKELEVATMNTKNRKEEALGAIEEIIANAKLYSGITGYTFDFDNTTKPDDPEEWGTGLFSKAPSGQKTAIDIPEVYVQYPEFWNVFSGGSTDYFTLSPSNYTYGKETDVLAKFDNQVALMNGYDKYLYPLTKKEIESLKEEAAAMLEDEKHIDALKKYDDMVAAYKGGDFLAYANEYVYVAPTYTKEDVVETAVKDYNDALAAFEKAFNDYKTAFEASAGNQEYYDKLAKIQADEAAAIAKANADYYTAMQAAQVTYSKAEADYEAAEYAHTVALRTRNRAIYDAVMTAEVETGYTDKLGVTHYWTEPGPLDYDMDIANFDANFNAAVALMNAFITDYKNNYDPTNGGSVPDKTADQAAYDNYLKDNAIYTRYVPAVDAVEKAKLAYSDPANDTDPDKSDPHDVWEKAKEVHNKADGEKTAAQSKAKETWDRTLADIELEYDKKEDELAATKPVLDTYYAGYLQGLVDDNSGRGAYSDLKEAISELDRILKAFFIDASPSVVDLSYDVISDLTTTPPTTAVEYEFNGVLKVLVNEDKDALVPIAVKDVVALMDSEYFKENVIEPYYDEIFDAYDGGKNIGEILCADYPLSYPKYEDVAEYAAQKEVSLTSRYELKDKAPAKVTGKMALYYDKLLEAAYKEKTNAEYDPAAVAETVKALEAAKAEVEKFMKEKEAELEAIRKEVEETVPPVIEEMKTLKAEVDALSAKNKILTNKQKELVALIKMFCNKIDVTPKVDDLKKLVEALEKAYDVAVTAVADKEDQILKAEAELQEFLDGKVDAVTQAQRKFEDAEIALEAAQKALEKATAELQKAIELIYGDEELPEDPAPENPAPEDPGTGDEGGEEETPAA